jgi:glutamyl-tRNA reductase
MISNLRTGQQLLAITLSRTTAPVEVRERLAQPLDTWAALLAAWVPAVHEWIVLATCHRFELYVMVDEAATETTIATLSTLLTQVSGADCEIAGHLWLVRTDQHAVNHLCRVAAGLDSMVLGEAQIQGQVVGAYQAALEEGTVGPALSAAFRTAIRVGKRARAETNISVRATSMSSVALAMVAPHIPDFAQARVVVVGAGEMSRLALKALFVRHAKHVTIVNRTVAHAESARLDPDWQVAGLERLADVTAVADLIFSATSASDYILTKAQVEQALTTRARTLAVVDLAMPRDVAPDTRELDNVYLIDVDTLREGIDLSLASRSQAVPAVSRIIDEEMSRWHDAMRELSLRPIVVELRQRAERIRQQEVDRTMRFIGEVDSDTQAHIHHLSRALVNKLLHEPTVRIKELSHNDDAEHYVATLCDIFGLETSAQQEPRVRG